MQANISEIFVLNFTDFLCLQALNNSSEYVFKIFDNGYLFRFKSFSAFMLSKLVLPDGDIFFISSI